MDAPNEARLPRLVRLALPLLALLPACGHPSEEAVATRIQGSVHFLDGYPARAADGRLNVVIEVPAGTLAKWEVDAESGALIGSGAASPRVSPAWAGSCRVGCVTVWGGGGAR